MKYVVSWTLRLNGSAKENDEAMRRGLELYAKWTPPAGTTIHQLLFRVDGSGGLLVAETDNPADLLDGPSKFGFLLDYQTYPVVESADWVQAYQQGIEFRG